MSRSTRLSKRSKKRPVSGGPVVSKTGVPYDYIVIIDSGSTGSRVFVYNWLNPSYVLKKGLDYKELLHKSGFNLLKKRLVEYGRERDEKDGDEYESDIESATQYENEAKGPFRFPRIGHKDRWYAKVKPGIASFNTSPQKIGKHHLKHLLDLASSVVPKSQHYRTPIFLHSTAGMRLLNPTEQERLLSNICDYFRGNSDFYLPDCASHINVLDGNVEGLYGWLAINYLKGALDDPESHNHGKNHTTYGLLDMGGASTQVVFEPNLTENRKHKKNLFLIELTEVPRTSINDTHLSLSNEYGTFSKPKTLDYDVYSDSFLGFGIYQAYQNYSLTLIDNFKKERKIDAETSPSYLDFPVPDPCMPKGYTTKRIVGDEGVHFTGESDFPKCLASIFPVLLKSPYNYGADKPDGDCTEFNNTKEVSSCLMNENIPAFDFDVNHFIGVSAYWDSVESLLEYHRTHSNTENSSKRGNKKHKNKNKDPETYDYKTVYRETEEICSESLSGLIKLNDDRPSNDQLTEVELSELCFKSSWILNFLHLGLGFPRFGIDKITDENSQFKSLELVENIGDSSFSWTLGRAILYANDEYVQAFNNFTLENISQGKGNPENIRSKLLKRPGFYYSAAPNVYHYGAEEDTFPPRPRYTESEDYSYSSSYTSQYEPSKSELKWNIEPHRWYGFLTFSALLILILWLMIGSRGRATLKQKIEVRVRGILSLKHKINFRRHPFQYFKLNTSSTGTMDFELGHVPQDTVPDNSKTVHNEQFIVSEDDDKPDLNSV